MKKNSRGKNIKPHTGISELYFGYVHTKMSFGTPTQIVFKLYVL